MKPSKSARIRNVLLRSKGLPKAQQRARQIDPDPCGEDGLLFCPEYEKKIYNYITVLMYNTLFSPCSWQGAWNLVIFKVSFILSHSMRKSEKLKLYLMMI